MAVRSITRISKAIVDRLTTGQVIWDSEVKGFGVRCQAKAKVYLLKKVIDGKPKWLTIGNHGSPWTPDKARIEALRLLSEIAQGNDPSKSLPADRSSMTDLCARYLEQHAVPKKKESSVKLDRMNIRNHVLPLLGSKRVADVDATDIEAFKIAVFQGKTAPTDRKQKSISQGGGITVRGGHGVANRCLTLLATMFKLAEVWGLRPKNSSPVIGVTRYRETPKERFLSKEEFKRLGSTLDEFEAREKESVYAIAAIRLLYSTGARLGEILALKWDFVQIEQNRLRLPDSKTGAKTISLSPQAVKLILAIPRFSDNPYVIVGGKVGRHLVDLQRPWQRVRQAAGLDDVRLHDLRHSYASLALQNGISLSVIGQLLGHKSTETTKRYAHLADDHISTESKRIGDWIDQAISREKAIDQG